MKTGEGLENASEGQEDARELALKADTFWSFHTCCEFQIYIYDIPMKFAHKLIHGGPVHHCHEPVGVLQWCMVLSECMLEETKGDIAHHKH